MTWKALGTQRVNLISSVGWVISVQISKTGTVTSWGWLFAGTVHFILDSCKTLFICELEWHSHSHDEVGHLTIGVCIVQEVGATPSKQVAFLSKQPFHCVGLYNYRYCSTFGALNPKLTLDKLYLKLCNFVWFICVIN